VRPERKIRHGIKRATTASNFRDEATPIQLVEWRSKTTEENHRVIRRSGRARKPDEVATMTNITQTQIDDFKSLYPGNLAIQALSLTEVLANTSGRPVDWGSIPFQPTKTAALVAGSSLSLTDCQMKIGYVIFDVVCLAVGAVGLRSTVNSATIEGIFRAAAPVMSKIEVIIAEMAAKDASLTDLAYGVFRILQTIYSGGSLGAVFSAFTASLTWWDMILYGITGTATIIAALATDGVAFVAEIIIVLATFGFLASDSVKAVSSCTLPAPTDLTDGTRIRDITDGYIYLALDGALRHIPDPQTYTNLFKDWSSVTSLPNVQNYLVGTPITEGASLVKGTPDGKVFLLIEGGKRWISSPPVFDRYGFAAAAIKTLTADQLNTMPTGATLY
jgi:hypothetical protein